MQTYLKQTTKEEVKSWIQTTLTSFLKKNQENQGEIEHIIDYLNSPQAPKRLIRMSYDQAKASTDKWLKTMMKRGNNIVETDADVEIILRSKSTGFRLVKLVGENAFKREGFLMKHCVASYAGKTDTEVYSLRDANNSPHCTIEVQQKNGEIAQIKGKGNGSIHPRYIRYVLKILKYFKMEIRDSEMQNLGYFLPSEGLRSFIDLNFKSFQYISFQSKKYIYQKSKFE